MPATVTAAVPCTSSLKLGTTSRKWSRMRRALGPLKSSHWMTQPGQVSDDAPHEGLDELLVGRAAQPPRAVADVERVTEQLAIVGADVEGDRQREGGMQTARGRVEGQLADGDAHAAGALVAEAEDALVVGHDDEADVRVGRVAQDLRDAVDVGGRDPDAARASDDVAELLAGLAHRGRVDDGHELFEMVGQEPIEERRVAVLERGQADVLLEGVVLALDVLPLELHLLLDALDAVGQQTTRRPKASRSSWRKAMSLVKSRAPRRRTPRRSISAGRPATIDAKGSASGFIRGPAGQASRAWPQR